MYKPADRFPVQSPSQLYISRQNPSTCTENIFPVQTRSQLYISRALQRALKRHGFAPIPSLSGLIKVFADVIINHLHPYSHRLGHQHYDRLHHHHIQHPDHVHLHHGLLQEVEEIVDKAGVLLMEGETVKVNSFPSKDLKHRNSGSLYHIDRASLFLR